jgi:hypothetical protein
MLRKPSLNSRPQTKRQGLDVHNYRFEAFVSLKVTIETKVPTQFNY